jgi:hypothetical protein
MPQLNGNDNALTEAWFFAQRRVLITPHLFAIALLPSKAVFIAISANPSTIG